MRTFERRALIHLLTVIASRFAFYHHAIIVLHGSVCSERVNTFSRIFYVLIRGIVNHCYWYSTKKNSTISQISDLQLNANSLQRFTTRGIFRMEFLFFFFFWQRLYDVNLCREIVVEIMFNNNWHLNDELRGVGSPRMKKREIHDGEGHFRFPRTKAIPSESPSHVRLSHNANNCNFFYNITFLSHLKNWTHF